MAFGNANPKDGWMAKAHKTESFQREPRLTFFFFFCWHGSSVGRLRKKSLTCSKEKGKERRITGVDGTRSKQGTRCCTLFTEKGTYGTRTNCTKVVLECWGNGNGLQGGRGHDAGVSLPTCVYVSQSFTEEKGVESGIVFIISHNH